jgi:hypothetical protein
LGGPGQSQGTAQARLAPHTKQALRVFGRDPATESFARAQPRRALGAAAVVPPLPLDELPSHTAASVIARLKAAVGDGDPCSGRAGIWPGHRRLPLPGWPACRQTGSRLAVAGPPAGEARDSDWLRARALLSLQSGDDASLADRAAGNRWTALLVLERLEWVEVSGAAGGEPAGESAGEECDHDHGDQRGHGNREG